MGGDKNDKLNSHAREFTLCYETGSNDIAIDSRSFCPLVTFTLKITCVIMTTYV
jgi:hypothetical protein